MHYGLGGCARLFGPIDSGQRGEVWLMTTDQGRYAVKLPFQRISEQAAARDAAYQDLVRASGVPMPAVVRSRDGEVLADVCGRQVRVYEWVDVLPATRDLDPVAVGALLAQVHQVEAPAPGPVREWFTAPVGAAAWAELVEQLRAQDAPFVDRVAALVPQFVDLERRFEQPEPVVMCHCDLWLDNVRKTRDGGLVILDWENCGPESPSHELGMVVFEFGHGDPQRMLDLYAAYLFAGGPGRLGRHGDLTMVGAACEHLAEEGCRSWLCATTEAERREAASAVTWLLSDPVTPAVVKDLLEAVAGVSGVG